MGSGSSAQKGRGPSKFSDKYSLSHDLGSGAYSVVKLAREIQGGKEYAVKLINSAKLSPDDLSSLTTEISILKLLDHPHIIKLYEVYDEPPQYFLVTELVSGGELFDRIVSKQQYTEKEARDLIKLFLETMNYMHELDVVHRDLKPENLLLCSDKDDADIKIADFGFAKKISTLQVKEQACGTPGYVAPEILRGDRYGAEVDIWSMGVICYVLLAGYPPFYDEDQKKLFRKIKNGQYHFHEEYWKAISPEAIDLITKMLTVNQKQRWTAKMLLSHPWITASNELLAGRELDSTIKQLKRYNARRRLRAAADAVIAANRISAGLSKLLSAGRAMSQEESNIVDDDKPSLEDMLPSEEGIANDSDAHGGEASKEGVAD